MHLHLINLFQLNYPVHVSNKQIHHQDIISVHAALSVSRLSMGVSGPRSSVGIATELRDGRSGDRNPVGERFSAPVQTGPGAHPASCTMGTGSLPG
jgi:hypothetical protein